MTTRTNARIAGFMFLFYIVSGIVGMIFFEQATKGADAAAKLASITAHLPQFGVAFLFALVGIFNALVLGAALYALTRDQDRDLALLGLLCRVVEGAINAVPAFAILALFALATGAVESDAVTTRTLAAMWLKASFWSTSIGATVFALGSALFAYLLLKARSIPSWLGWVGLVASVQLLVTAPLTGLGVIRGAGMGLMWLPMLVFEVTLGLLLLIRGTTASANATATNTTRL